MNNQPTSQQNQSELRLIAEYLRQRQDEILSQWQNLVQANGEVSELMKNFPEEFYDDIPQFLEMLLTAFRGEPPPFQEDPAEKHGAQRWRLGINIKEIAREWGHLHEVLIRQIADYQRTASSCSPDTLRQAYHLLAQQIYHGLSESIAQFHALHRLEADARMRDLEAAIRQWRDMEARRDEYLRHVLHDLRGGLSVIRLAGAVLKLEGSKQELIETAEDIIGTTESMSHLLNQLRDLARLEAEREPLEIAAIDAAEILRSLCNTMCPLAQEKGLALICEGETPLPVRGDGNKLQRIAQNLVLNALHYTQEGRVEVGWRSEANGRRWSFYVRDSGPGLPSTGAETLRDGMEQPTTVGQPGNEDEAGDAGSPGGEGIGLLIVRRLCDLLEGSINVESTPGQGTEFRIMLPVNYPEARQPGR